MKGKKKNWINLRSILCCFRFTPCPFVVIDLLWELMGNALSYGICVTWDMLNREEIQV